MTRLPGWISIVACLAVAVSHLSACRCDDGTLETSATAQELGAPPARPDPEAFGERQDDRDRLVESWSRDRRLDQITAPAVREAMLRVPRHAFVARRYRSDAYDDRPLPIGHGVTISQPYIVALMTQLLDLDAQDRVLEVGTGSGYQAAVLAEIVAHVYTIEIIDELAQSADERLAALNYENVTVRGGDGYYGWPHASPFDGIIVTAAAGHVPPPLLAQLAPGGRMVIPVGSPYDVQRLVLVTKDESGDVSSRDVLPVRFVPLTGAGASGP